jgi:flagellar hook-associated protein 1 FlgK
VLLCKSCYKQIGVIFMRSTFSGLSIALSGAWAQQKALDVTGHNISNVNTEGYARQTINTAASLPSMVGVSGNGGVMKVGTGVDVAEIKQYRDYFLDQKLRRENQSLGYWEAKKGAVEELETIFNDNAEDGLQTVMDSFWNSWAQLSKPTGGLTARALVKENAIAFVETVKNMDTMLSSFRKNKNEEIKQTVDRINTLTKGIADLNYEIKKAEANGAKASDLRDQRELNVQELSKLAKIQVIEGSSFNIAMEGRLVVSDTNSEALAAVPDAAKDGYYSIKWSRTMEDIDVGGGTLKALMETRDQLVDGYRARLNEFVKGVAEEVNKLHHKGFGNIDGGQRYMFLNEQDNSAAGISIGNICFNPELAEVNHIAAADMPPPGNYEDNQNALEISQWRLKDVFSDTGYDPAKGKFNFDEFYRGLISDIGLEGNKAANAADAQRLVIEQVEGKRQSIMGVSLDEEMSNLIRYEHSYNAAARIVNAIDEMLEVIVNKIGLSGR